MIVLSSQILLADPHAVNKTGSFGFFNAVSISVHSWLETWSYYLERPFKATFTYLWNVLMNYVNFQEL